MIKKEISWNVALLVTGAFLVFFHAFKLTWGATIIPGWQDPQTVLSPFGAVNKWAASLAIGVCLMAFRYVLMAILAIRHADLRLLVLLASYMLPFLLILVGYHYALKDTLIEFSERQLPLEHFAEKVEKLRECGFFKKDTAQSKGALTDILIGRYVRTQNGYLSSAPLMTEDFKEIQTVQLLKLDTAKTCTFDDTEWVIEGNRAYESFLRELSRISERQFEPTYIKEQWTSPTSVEVAFDVAGKKHQLKPIVDGDWADTNTILKYLNNLLKPRDYQFYYVAGDDVIIVGLTDKEREKLTDKLKIQLNSP